MAVTEKQIQNDLYYYLYHHGMKLIFPNMDVITGYEADIIALTGRNYASEYEIKISLADFRADRKKVFKHASLAQDVRKHKYPYDCDKDRELWVKLDAPDDPYQALRYVCLPDRIPKHFWYVIHGFDVPAGELPDYAGLMRYEADSRQVYGLKFKVVRKAPQLKARPVDEKTVQHATTNMLYRYWTIRLKTEAAA